VKAVCRSVGFAIAASLGPNSFDVLGTACFLPPCLVIANGRRAPRARCKGRPRDQECAPLTAGGGCPSVARPYACGPRRHRDPGAPLPPRGSMPRSCVALNRPGRPVTRDSGRPSGERKPDSTSRRQHPRLFRCRGPAFVSSFRKDTRVQRLRACFNSGWDDALCNTAGGARLDLFFSEHSTTSPPARPFCQSWPRAGGLPGRCPGPAGAVGRVGAAISLPRQYSWPQGESGAGRRRFRPGEAEGPRPSSVLRSPPPFRRSFVADVLDDDRAGSGRPPGSRLAKLPTWTTTSRLL